MLYVCSGNVKVFEIASMHLHIYAMKFHSALVATRVASPEETHSLAALEGLRFSPVMTALCLCKWSLKKWCEVQKARLALVQSPVQSQFLWGFLAMPLSPRPLEHLCQIKAHTKGLPASAACTCDGNVPARTEAWQCTPDCRTPSGKWKAFSSEMYGVEMYGSRGK